MYLKLSEKISKLEKDLDSYNKRLILVSDIELFLLIVIMVNTFFI